MTGLLLFDAFHGKRDIGSSRIRGDYLIKHWPEAERFRIGRKYETVIYQKVYWTDHAESFEGLKILDLCDPDFMAWGYPVKRMIDACDGVACSSLALAEAIATFAGDKPVAFINDRFDMDIIPREKKKTENRPAETAVWYGYSQNYPLLDTSVPSLVKHGIKKLVVISDKRNPYKLPAGMDGRIEVEFIPWTVARYIEDLKRGDFVLNPRSEGAHWRFKSDNKTSLARLVGMPVAHNEDELKRFIDPKEREKESLKWLARERDMDSRESVKEMKAFIDVCRDEKMRRASNQAAV